MRWQEEIVRLLESAENKTNQSRKKLETELETGST